MAHWKSKFGKISANELFNQVDTDKNGTIDIKEFTTFFEVVKRSGHSEEEICAELDNIANGEVWVGFSGVKIGRGTSESAMKKAATFGKNA